MNTETRSPCDDCPDLKDCIEEKAVIDITSWEDFLDGERHYLVSPYTICTKYLSGNWIVEAEE